MKLLNLKIKGFRKYKDLFEVNFNDETYIIGGNGKGKSTIAYAIVWTFLGTDMRGNDKISMVNRDCEECFAELQFIDNTEKKHTLVRYKNTRYDAKNFVALDGTAIRQKDLKELFFKDNSLFLCIFNPDYFKDLEPSKQKELIDKYLPDVSFDEVFEKLEEDEKQKVNILNGDISKYIKDTTERIKEAENKIKIQKGKIEYAKKIIEEKLEDYKEFNKQEELDALEMELDYIKQESKQSLKERLENQIQEAQANEINTQNKLDKIMEKGKKAKIEYNKLLSDPLSLCPCCNNPLNSDSKKIALENKRKEIFSLYDEKKECEEQLSDLKAKTMILKSKYYSIKTTNSSERILEIERELNKLKQERQEIKEFNNSLKIKNDNIQKSKQDITNFIIENEKLDENIDMFNMQISIAKKLFLKIIQEKIKNVEKYMKNTKIQFYELIKSTGEIKDCFKITRNGVDIKDLSRSEKFVTVLEICNMLNKISGLNIPILIDDSESYPDYNFKFKDFETQLIIIKAKKNRMLKVSKNEEKIANVKTININRKHLSKVA